MAQSLHNIPQLPPRYQTSLAVRSAISQAYSGMFNSRGLEAHWHAAYLHTFSELAAPYDGHLIATCQYPLYISELRMEELNLKKKFAELGLSFDSDDSDYDELVDEDLWVDNDTEDILAGLNTSGGRESRRLLEDRAKKEEANSKRQMDLKKDLLKQKEQLINDMNERGAALNPDVSQASVASLPEPNAKDMAPDFTLCHVPFSRLPAPGHSRNARKHYEHRAGVKVAHRCCVLIAELKKAPPRAFRGPTNAEVTYDLLEKAQTQVLLYCSAHFEITQQAESVIAFAAAGLLWSWAVIKPEDVEGLCDWTGKLMVQEDGKRSKNHRGEFPEHSKAFVLGTLKSDAQLSKISREHIYPMLSDNHTTRFSGA